MTKKGHITQKEFRVFSDVPISLSSERPKIIFHLHLDKFAFAAHLSYF